MFRLLRMYTLFPYTTLFRSGWGLIKNTGTMTKTAGTNTDTFDVPVDNGTGGSLTVNTGVLDLDDGGGPNQAHGAFAGAGNVRFTAGTFLVGDNASFAGGSTINGATIQLDRSEERRVGK